VENNEWMNDQVREEIERLQRRYGFKEDEAIAYWHLRNAADLMIASRRAEVEERLRREERDIIPTAEASALISSEMSAGHVRILQHFTALYRELERRVLSRTYPKGWGNVPDDDEGNED